MSSNDPNSTQELKDSSKEPADIGLPSDWTVYVVDSHSLIFQVFHAIPEMTSPRGEQVNALFGFTKDMMKLIEEKRPDALLCAFDLPGGTFRNDLFDGYKAGRGEMPTELASQLPKINEIVEALGIPVLAVPGFEADDILATVARLCHEAGATCKVVTGDKDCRQLITENVTVYNIRKDLVYDDVALAADWGVRPDQVVDFQALVGDKVDNVPGVPLIGPKIAKELLEQFDTLDSVLDNADKVKGAKRQQNLREGRELALLSQQLVRLDNKVPIEIDWQAAKVGDHNQERLAELFAGYGFRTLAQRAAALDKNASIIESDWEADYQLIDTVEKLDSLVATLADCETISFDTETTALSPRFAELVGMSLSWEAGKAAYVAIRGPVGDRVIPLEAVLERLGPILEDPKVAKIGQNLKYDSVVLRGAGITLRGISFDTMIGSYLLDAGERSHGLDVLSERYLGHETTKIKELIGTGKKQKRMDEVPVKAVSDYAGEDADVPIRLWPLLHERLDNEGLLTLNNDLETPLVKVLAEMEWNGIQVDNECLSQLSERFAKRSHELAVEIETMVGHPFNLASPKQLAEVLFQELGLPVLKKTKTGPSTDASVLEQLAEMHPLPKLIVEHRMYAKLRGTYVDALPELIHPETGRVHCSFNQVVAATGRLSCSDPNLQNIPIRTDAGRSIRSAFVASDGCKLLAADYSQIELRVLAHFSGDETLCKAFAEGQDIHTLVASQVNNISLEEVTSDQRRGAKAVNFGIIYGQSAFGLAKSLGIPKGEAARFIDEYFARYPGVGQFMHDTLADCFERGYVETMFGRRRAVSGVRPPAPPSKGSLFDNHPQPIQMNMPERTAFNTVIQGTAADLIKMAMLSVYSRMNEEGLKSKLLLQIHDELLFDVPEEELEVLEKLVLEEMQEVADLDVPLSVDVGIGVNWAECK